MMDDMIPLDPQLLPAGSQSRQTPSPPPASSSLNHTPEGPHQVNKAAKRILQTPALSKDLKLHIQRLTKSAIVIAEHAKLLESYLQDTE